MAAYVINAPIQVINSNGNTETGGKLKFFEPGGSNTPKAVYPNKDLTGGVLEVDLNARGMPDVGVLYGSGDYFVRVFDASNAEITNYELIEGEGSGGTASTEWELSALTPTFISTTSFSVIGDHRSTFQVNRRVKSSNTGGTMYGTITASVFSSVTTVTIANDGSDVLDSGLSDVSTGILSADNPSYPAVLVADVTGDLTGSILDANGNEVITAASVAASVNELTITNAATGNDIVIAVTGDDTNPGMDMQTKGTGQFQVNGVAIEESPAFSAYRAGDYAYTTPNDIVFNTEEFDVTGDYDVATGRFTPSVAGKYFVYGQVGQLGLVAGSEYVVYICKNGVSTASGRMAGMGSGRIWPNVSALVSLNGSTDYVSIQSQHTATVEGSLLHSTRFSAFRVQA